MEAISWTLSSGRKPNSPGMHAISPALRCTFLETGLIRHWRSILFGGGSISFGIPIGRGLAEKRASARSISSDSAAGFVSLGGRLPPPERRRRRRRPRRRLPLFSSLNGVPSQRGSMNPPRRWSVLSPAGIDVVEQVPDRTGDQPHHSSKGPRKSQFECDSPYRGALRMPVALLCDNEHRIHLRQTGWPRVHQSKALLSLLAQRPQTGTGIASLDEPRPAAALAAGVIVEHGGLCHRLTYRKAIPGSNGKATRAFPATSSPSPTGYASTESTSSSVARQSALALRTAASSRPLEISVLSPSDQV